jgi:uncharacterized protein (TIGR03086 family)
MPAQFDLGPTADEVARVVQGIGDDDLALPSPCPDSSVGDLLDHFMGLTTEFRQAATKETVERARAGGPANAPGGSSVDRLDSGWRTELPSRLAALAAAWRADDAWDGLTMAGGVELPAEVMARVAADELVMHGWDLAVATGQDFQPDHAGLRACYEFTLAAAEPGAPRDGLFGPIVAVPDDAPLLHRALGLAGRDPHWTP